MGATHVPVLKQVNLRIAHGEMTAIVGASGSGKSTLMNIIGLLDKPTSGEYFFEGQNISQCSEAELAMMRNKKIGFVFQSFFLLPRANALENVMLPLFYRGVPRVTAKQMATLALAKVNLNDVARHLPNQLSGGQQQRVAIARALVTDPQVILADEPTGALDSETSNEVMALFKRLHQSENRTIVIITHDKNISHRCQSILTIHDGKVIN